MPRRGENIYKRKDGRWEGRYIKGHTNGKTRYGYIYARSYKEVKEKLSLVLVESEAKEKPARQEPKAPSNVTFREIAAEWLEALTPQLKESSIVKYSNIMTLYLFPRFKNSIIEKITRDEILEFNNKLKLCGNRKGEGLSPRTVTSILSVLKSIFKYAEQYKKLDVANINNISVRQPQKPLRILSLAEQRELSRYLYEHLTPTNLGILVCLYTGIRLGEVCALKWEDISSDEQYLYIHKTMQRIQNSEISDKEGADKENSDERKKIPKTSILISTPKSECSIRRIPLPGDILQLVNEARQPGNTYFLTGKSNIFVEPRTLQNRFKAIMNECNIKGANFHALRHTFATRCVELGFDTKSLSEILGHASVNMTLNRYVHPSMELKQKNMNRLSEIFAVK